MKHKGEWYGYESREIWKSIDKLCPLHYYRKAPRQSNRPHA
jgi:hypothetical protein